MDKKEIEVFIKQLNESQIERMKRDDDEEEILDLLDESERFRGGGAWTVQLTIPQPVLDLLPEWEQGNWWEVGWVIDEDNEGFCQDEAEALENYGVKSEDEMNPIFCRRYYEFTKEETQWWQDLEKEYKHKIDLPFKEILFEFG